MGNYFTNALGWTKCFPAGGCAAMICLRSIPLNSSGPPSLLNFFHRSIPPFCLRPHSCVIPHEAGPSRPCPYWVVDKSSGSSQSPSHESVQNRMEGSQEGREVANFPWCGGGAGVELWTEKHGQFLGYKQREKRIKCKTAQTGGAWVA